MRIKSIVVAAAVVLLAAVCRAQERYVEAPARTVPVIDRVDVVVVGGNEGGMAAAWSAARQGSAVVPPAW